MMRRVGNVRSTMCWVEQGDYLIANKIKISSIDQLLHYRLGGNLTWLDCSWIVVVVGNLLKRAIGACQFS